MGESKSNQRLARVSVYMLRNLCAHPAEWIDKYTAQQLGEIAALLKSAYDDGVQYGRNHAE